jgi:predicted aldo/keto reductase-like oxidoreductase
MLYNEYGKTGDMVSRIGFGAMRFADIDDEDRCAVLVLRAYERGINYFDTAKGYFGGKSEERLGLAFKEMQSQRSEKPFYVSTKTTARDPDEIFRDCEGSLERMGLDYIDYYHVWYLTSLEEYEARKAAGLLDGFRRLQDEGLIRHISVSSHLPGHEVGQLLQDFPFAGVLLGYSAMNYQYRQEGVEVAAARGQAVVTMNPLGGGQIPAHPELFSYLRTREEETLVQGALRFLLDDTRISVALVGMAEESHVDEAVIAAEGYKPLSASQRMKVESGLSDAMDRICTGCGYCTKVCPEDIPIPGNMLSYNGYMLSGYQSESLINNLKYNYRLLDDDRHGLDRCIECGECEAACTQHLPILERFEEMKKIMADQNGAA